MSFSSAERFEAHQERDIELVKEVGRAVKEVAKDIDARIRALGFVEMPTGKMSERNATFTYSELIGISNNLNGALDALRKLGRREQQEITDFLAGEL